MITINKRILIPVLLVIFSGTAVSEEIPVLLMVDSKNQNISHGCNFVNQLSDLLYESVMDKSVILWDSKDKDIQILPSALKEIERSSGIRFHELNTLFVYEIWDKNRKEIRTKTIGIGFANIDKENSANVSFGYIDYEDVRELFLKRKIPTNANGRYSSTFTTYILDHNYHYTLVQFNDQPVSSASESENIKREYTKGLLFNKSLIGYYPPDKYISYLIDTYSDEGDSATYYSNEMLRVFEQYFTDNLEVFYNHGGDRIVNYLDEVKLKVTKVEIREMWRIIGERVTFDPVDVIVHVNDSALNEIPFRNIRGMNIFMGEEPLSEVISKHKFNFIISKINNQVIKRHESYLYQKALLDEDWNRIIEYVINF